MCERVTIASNKLLDTLPNEVRARVSQHAESISFDAGAVLHEPNAWARFCYFPSTATVSLAYQMKDGIATEVAVIGKEGLVGISLLTGAPSMPCFAVVQQGGTILRIPVDRLRTEYEHCTQFVHALLRYTLVLVSQMSQTAACNRLHGLDHRLSRWLLCSQDRSDITDLLITHESLSHVLGVRREAVSHTAARLQSAGLIRYSRGRIRILDRAGLIARACECYTPPSPIRRASSSPARSEPLFNAHQRHAIR